MRISDWSSDVCSSDLVAVIQLLRWLLDHPQEAGVRPGLINGLSDPRLARALASMHDNPGHAWTLDRMAEYAGMSRTAFANTFREEVGQTPGAYLGNWRIALAQGRLREGRPLQLLAKELGYANHWALSRPLIGCASCGEREGR